MSDFKFSINETEYARLKKALGQLTELEQNDLIKKGYKEGSQMLITAGKASFLTKNKKVRGNLYRSFTDKLKKKRKGSSGILVGFKRGAGKGNHSHLIDRGTVDRYTKKGYYRGRIQGTERGKTGATYFWTNTVELTGQEAMYRVVDAIHDAINEIISRR